MKAKEISVRVVWKSGPVAGSVDVVNGKVGTIKPRTDRAASGKNAFGIRDCDECELKLSIRDANTEAGSGATIVTIQEKKAPFSFFLRDVNGAAPVFIPAYGVAVLPGSDRRSYAQVESDVQTMGLRTAIQDIECGPEDSYEAAAQETFRQDDCETWLGLGRDMRTFRVGYSHRNGYLGYIRPMFHSVSVRPDKNTADQYFQYVVGRGCSCVHGITRRLEDGYLPILHTHVEDGDIVYDVTCFVVLEKTKLSPENIRGTHYLVADAMGVGHMHTEDQQKQCESLMAAEKNREEETVLCMRVSAVNTSATPSYAWFKNMAREGTKLDGRSGFLKETGSRKVACITKLDGKPMKQEEMAFLVQPGESRVIDIVIPHQPIPVARARKLARIDPEVSLDECRKYWRRKESWGASIDLPDPVIDRMVKAGLFHLDLVSYGREPDGAIAATIGVYSPIGSESAPIIQFFDSMAWHNVAGRALNYFAEKQHDDGFMQNFGGYMLETGAALWSMGEHYRYTRDRKWARSIRKNLLKACEYMLAWRNRNRRRELKGFGYAMQEGKTADPVDPFHSFMLNGYSYMGMSRAAEILADISPADGKRWQSEARKYREDIRREFFAALGRSPVVPLKDGSWVPSAPPWAEGTAPVNLFVEPGKVWTHGTFTGRDSMLGPTYLVFQEVLDPREPASDFLLNWNAEEMCVRNLAFSQPYYCRNAWIHLKRDESKAFLKTYFSGAASMPDRDTFTWWEHLFQCSPHKTHEEGWFLMQTRWMLWMEEEETLRLLRGIPSAWLENGKRIALNRVASYFGPVDLDVRSELEKGSILATVKCEGKRRPRNIVLRLPHPDGRKPVAVEGGKYDSQLESVIIKNFSGRANVKLSF